MSQYKSNAAKDDNDDLQELVTCVRCKRRIKDRSSRLEPVAQAPKWARDLTNKG